jgi:hypothetical protein
MGRTTKHPALIQKQISEALDRARDEAFALTPGWETFNQDERDFLSMMAVHKTMNATCEAMGKNPSWATRHQQSNVYFKDAVLQQRQDLNPAVLQSQIRMLLPGSIIELRKTIEQDKNLSAKMDGIRHLHSITGFSEEKESGAQFVNNGVMNQQLFQVTLSQEDVMPVKVLDATE